MKPPSTARTAGKSGGCGGASDASRLSCFLFRPRKSREKRRNRGHTNVSNTLVTRTSTPPAQTATFAFTGESGYTLGFRRKIAHSGLHAETGSVSDGGWYPLPSERFARFGNPAWPGGRTANFAAFGSWPGVLPKNAESLRDSDAHDARRCPEASRPRWAA